MLKYAMQDRIMVALNPHALSDADDYEQLRDSLGKLRLNDAALCYEPETSGAMGFGFRCGFLGLLHMEIVQERLSREYDMDLIVTAPSVVYKVITGVEGKEKTTIVDTPSKMPEGNRETKTLEPFVRMEILTPSEYNGVSMSIVSNKSLHELFCLIFVCIH